jgi:1-acyl-sn-glycerol-3-phosphate acyltransferase
MDKKYWDVCKWMKFFFRLVTETKIEGRDTLPLEGAFILATNHISRLDSPALMIASPRRLYGMVADKYRSFIGYNWLLNAAGVIWIRRAEFDREALLRAMRVLKEGHVLALAPEGTRSYKGSGLQPGKPGVAFLAARAHVPIVPVAVTGTDKMLESFKRLKRMPVRIRFGLPFRLPKEGRLSSQELDAYTELIMRRIADLLPSEYRGVYADLGVANRTGGVGVTTM